MSEPTGIFKRSPDAEFAPPDSEFTFGKATNHEPSGATYTPFFHKSGHGCGYRVVFPNGAKKYVYLNPSTDGDTHDDPPNVFLYIGSVGDPSYDTPCRHHYNIHPSE